MPNMLFETDCRAIRDAWLAVQFLAVMIQRTAFSLRRRQWNWINGSASRPIRYSKDRGTNVDKTRKG